MWWDIPHWYIDDERFPQVENALIDVMARVLELPSVACQESALHGLGYWHEHYPERTTAIIDEFLGRHSHLRPELEQYARRARRGVVR